MKNSYSSFSTSVILSEVKNLIWLLRCFPSLYMTVMLFVFCFILVSAVNTSLAQWSHDSTVNNPIGATPYGEGAPKSVSDGAGGAIITWQVVVGTGDIDIVAQRINAAGYTQWQTNGKPISLASREQISPQICSDGAGGAIIVWQDFRDNVGWDVYAQRVNSVGVVLWTEDGVPISTTTNSQEHPVIVSDGAGGAIIAWQDNRSGVYDIYAQRINASGAVQWTANGVGVCTWLGAQESPQMVSDGAGGAIITWEDARSGTSDWDIFAQKINGAGVLQWSSFSVAISTPTSNQLLPKIATDGAGGAVIAWVDYRAGAGIATQKVNASGNVQWTTNGVEVGGSAADFSVPALASDGVGGAIFAMGYLPDYSILVFRLNSLGTTEWAKGHWLSDVAVPPQIVSDGSGGAIVTWEDYSGYLADSLNPYDIYAMKVNSSGVMQWDTIGTPISTYLNNQRYPVLVDDGSGGAIISWVDSRNGNYDIYAQKIDRYGNLGDNGPQIVKVKDVNNDQGGKVMLLWKPSYLDAWPQQTVTKYAIYLGVRPTAAVAGSIALNPEEYFKEERNPSSLLAKGGKVAQGNKGKTYLKLPLSPNSSDTLYWELFTNVNAEWLDGYSYNVYTPSDSGPQGSSKYYFMVRAKTSNPTMFWNSNVDSGYSVDNLSPYPPLSLTAQVVSGQSVQLLWDRNRTDPDVGVYEVHRSTTSGFTPSSETKIGENTDTIFTDTSPVNNEYNYYRIITVDIHDNHSAPSPEASAGLQVKRQYTVMNKWNILSLPLLLDDYTKAVVYPTAVSDAFGYQGGYTQINILANGIGYWLKFSEDETISITGVLRTTDTASVNEGWNLVGSIAEEIAVSQIASDPPNMITSQFFGYDNGYSAIDAIEPGKGYWVKVNQSGKLILSSTVVSSSKAIRIVPTDELPPPPPDPETTNLKPETFALEQNYPNPFNPRTVIRFQLPVSSFVTLRVYNVLGEEVATLVNEMQDAGYKSIQFDASKLSSGVYLYRIAAGEFTETKRLMLIK